MALSACVMSCTNADESVDLHTGRAPWQWIARVNSSLLNNGHSVTGWEISQGRMVETTIELDLTRRHEISGPVSARTGMNAVGFLDELKVKRRLRWSATDTIMPKARFATQPTTVINPGNI
jgi:hypothetical protein